MRMTVRTAILAGVATMLVQPAFAQQAAPATPAPAATPKPAAQPTPAGTSQDIVVTGHLDEARASIAPSLGATDYSVTNATIQALPGGDNQQLNQVLLQLPGVVQDSFGQFHVRDDHNGLEYRINGAILPEGVAVFGQTLSPRLVERFDLKTGALPAQYGLRTAGIVDITTKNGFSNEGNVSIYGGSHDTIEPSIDYGGSTGSTNYFATASYTHNDLGIEAVDAGAHALHDDTNQYNAFTYVDHTLDPDDRVSFIGGYSEDHFEIPDPRGLHPDSGYNVDGQTDFLSDDLDERQRERTAFGIVSFLHTAGPATIQASLFGRYSGLDYYPDVTGELLFNGIAQRAQKQDFTAGGQFEGVYKLGDSHTLRGGIIISRDRSNSRTSSEVFPVDDDGKQTGQPITIADNGAATEWTESAYLQDEWKIIPHVTLNYGARFDHYCGFRCEQQLSPRVNAVFSPPGGFTLHAGYARYFSPPPFSNVASTDVGLFDGTSAASATTVGDQPYAERQDYFDIGVEQAIGHLTLGVDAYHRRSKNLIDEGQFGAPIILTPFNYARGRIDGIEFDANYQKGALQAYANFSIAKAKGEDIISGQFNFDPADLAYIQDHYIYLDHDQTYTGSGGITYKIARSSDVGLSMLYGSGLRRDGDVPNGGKLPPYAVFNLTASHTFDGPGIKVRFDVTNVLDHVYEIRDGSGIGVGAPQYGARRGFFVGLSKKI
jgi:outer membrane cobalamin receptor